MSKSKTSDPFAVSSKEPPPKNLAAQGRPALYPFKDMEVGDSFPIEDDEAATRVRSAAGYHNGVAKKQNQPNHFRVSKTPKGDWRCWRIT